MAISDPTVPITEREPELTGTVQQKLAPPSFRAKAFAVADRWFHRLVNLEKALYKGFWLGCLGPDDRNAVTTACYRGSRNILSAEYIQSGLFEWEASLVERYFLKGSRILVAAAGTGREILALRKAGFSAEGFECNLNLVAAGHKVFQQIGEKNGIAFCPPDDVPQGPRIYEGLIVGWGGYMHIPTRLRRIRFLQALRKRALPQCPLLISVFIRSRSSRYDTITWRTANMCRLVFRARSKPLEPGDDLDLGYFIHRFSRADLETELNAAGFGMLHYGEDGDSALVVAVAE